VLWARAKFNDLNNEAKVKADCACWLVSHAGSLAAQKRVGSSIRDSTYELGLISYYLNTRGVRNAEFSVLVSGLTEQEAIKFWKSYDP
jgi:hypothetical protein